MIHVIIIGFQLECKFYFVVFPILPDGQKRAIRFVGISLRRYFSTFGNLRIGISLNR
jgi:hypothetical protein